VRLQNGGFVWGLVEAGLFFLVQNGRDCAKIWRSFGRLALPALLPAGKPAGRSSG